MKTMVMTLMVNLGKETLYALINHGYYVPDIDFVQVREPDFFELRTVNVDDFFEIADKITYDNGYGAQAISPSLVIVMNDGCWFERAEYDGQEWWEYRECPKMSAHSFGNGELAVSDIADISVLPNSN